MRRAHVSACECLGVRREKIPTFHTTMFGPEIVLYNSVERLICSECGDETVQIPDEDGLVIAAALLRVLKPAKLSGPDIQFLRKAMDVSATMLAETLEVSLETVSRWENAKSPMAPGNEKLFRLIVGEALKDKAPAIRYDARRVFDMKVRACQDVEQTPILHLERVRFFSQRQDDEGASEAYALHQNAA